ncbi:MAG: FAD-dependent oxidoreductase [Methylobacter sp.]
MSASSPALVIAGAGATGIACALTAARRQIPVVLLEKSDRLGGTVTGALIHTLGGFFNDHGDNLYSGVPAELIDRLLEASPFSCKRRIGKTWVLNVDPTVYQQVVGRWLNEYATINVCYQTIINRAAINSGRIDAVTVTGNGQSSTLNTLAVIDATGRADVVRNIDSRLVAEGSALAGLIVQLGGVSPGALDFPKGLALLRHIRKATENHELPPECATLWIDSGVYPEEIYLKFNLPAKNYDHGHMLSVTDRVLGFLQTRPGFAEAFVRRIGQLGIRDGGRVHGDYTLTEADIKQSRRFDDAVCRAGWPIEYWHPEHGVSLDYFPPGHSYEIPLSALKASGLTNFFAAGKCFSAEPRAQASARVVGTCWAMGEGLINAHFGNA